MVNYYYSHYSYFSQFAFSRRPDKDQKMVTRKHFPYEKGKFVENLFISHNEWVERRNAMAGEKPLLYLLFLVREILFLTRDRKFRKTHCSGPLVLCLNQILALWVTNHVWNSRRNCKMLNKFTRNIFHTVTFLAFTQFFSHRITGDTRVDPQTTLTML